MRFQVLEHAQRGGVQAVLLNLHRVRFQRRIDRLVELREQGWRVLHRSVLVLSSPLTRLQCRQVTVRL
jgi:hypothetical protein